MSDSGTASFHVNRIQQWMRESPTHGQLFPTPARTGDQEMVHVQDVSTVLAQGAYGWDQSAAADKQHVEALQTAASVAYNAGVQAAIGAEPAPVWQNPLSQTPNLQRSSVTGDVYSTDAVPVRPPPTEQELRAASESVPGGIRILDGRRPMYTFPRDVAPPRLILPADLARWTPLENSFPVYVTYPGFGAGLAVSYLRVEAPVSFGVGTVYLAVKKFLPLGPTGREPFAVGFYAVPMWMAQMMEVAVANLYPAENIAVIDDFRGDQYSVAFTELRKTTDPRYVLARRALLLQYPYLMTDMMATNLRTRPPADMVPGGTLQGRAAKAPMLGVQEVPGVSQ